MWLIVVFLLVSFVFFFKQKTAYEMLRSLVGSEMCIRDRSGAGQSARLVVAGRSARRGDSDPFLVGLAHRLDPVSYTHLTLPTIYSV